MFVYKSALLPLQSDKLKTIWDTDNQCNKKCSTDSPVQVELWLSGKKLVLDLQGSRFESRQQLLGGNLFALSP